MLSRFIVFLFIVSLSSTIFGQVNEMPDSSAVTGIGKIFQITSSEFLNITVESTSDVFAYVQSIPQQITINVAKPEPEILSTTLTIRNLIPQTRYQLTNNGNTEVIRTNDAGVYICEVDLSLPHKIEITTHQ